MAADTVTGTSPRPRSNALTLVALLAGLAALGVAIYGVLQAKHAEQEAVYLSLLDQPRYNDVTALSEPELIRYRTLGERAAAVGPADAAVAAQRFVKATETSVTLDLKRRRGEVQGAATPEEQAANKEWGEARQALLTAFDAAF